MYKYFDISTKMKRNRVKEIFESDKLWFSAPKKLNDPFEFRFSPSFNATKKQKLQKCSELQRQTYGLNQKYAESRARILMKDPRSIRRWEKKNLRGLERRLHKETCLCCFSKVPNDILMWSHYANGHKGICICFSYRKKTYRDFSTKIHNVRYAKDNNIPKFNFYKERLENFPKKVLLTKGKSWKCEKECRGISLNSPEGYKIIPKGVINSVILGNKFRKKDLGFIGELKEIYNNSFKIYKTEWVPKKYKLVIKKSVVI